MRALLIRLLLAAFTLVLLAGCTDTGKVDQGRTVAFDKEKKTITIIRDASRDPAHPRYDVLPAITFQLPADPREMGPEPKPGLRIRLDPDKGEIVLYDPQKKNFDTIPIRIVEKHEGIKKNNPRIQNKTFPTVDQDSKIVTLYCSRHKLFVSFIPPEPYQHLTPEEWDVGDDVRIYSKEEGKALRLMNISRTDIFKK